LPKKKNILIISPESWSHIFVSKHHYSLELSKRGHNIFFLNPPDAQKFKEITVHQLTEAPNINIVDYPKQLKGLRKFPTFIRVYFNRTFLNRLERLINRDIDIVWSFENSRFFDLQFAGKRLKIYHQVDLNQTFNLRQAATSADICFCTTDLIKEQVSQYNKKVFKVHHGTPNEALKYKFANKVIPTGPIQAVYIGNLDMPFLDRDLFKNLVSSFPQVHFRLIGPYSKEGETYQILQQYRNIEWVGKQPATMVPGYLDMADVLLVLYAEKYHKDQASPHKFMEYFASGRVIVSTYTDEYKDKRELLAMSDQQEDYLELFKEVVNNIGQYNSRELQQRRKAFAEEHSYAKQVDRILNYCSQSNLEVCNA
jgi:hypothetical protein